KPMIIVASKMDVANPDKLAKLKKFAKKKKLAFYEISAVTGQGIPALMYALGNQVKEVRAGTHAPRKPARTRKRTVARKAGKPTAGQRTPKRAAFKKRKSR